MKEHQQIFIKSIDELREWLSNNYKSENSYWLVRNKKAYSENYISYKELVDELICFGWIDSLPRKLDESKTMLLISPRNPKSNWSRVNKNKVEKLIKKGRMHNAGLELVEKAKANGSWNFLDDVEELIIPSDLQDELGALKNAEFYFNRFPDSSKRGILEWIKNAKKEETRIKRIKETALKASQNIKANHPKGRDAGPKHEE